MEDKMTRGRKKGWHPVAPPVIDENTIKQYAETHSPEQTIGYLDGIKAMYESISHIVIPRDKNDRPAPPNKRHVWKDLIEFVQHKTELLDKLEPEQEDEKRSEFSPPNSDATLRP